ncbi:MAG: PIN/TRAM domain-containing protein [Phycisphaerae bacterium]
MVLHVIRALFLIIILAITVSFAFVEEIFHAGANYITLYILVPVALALLLVIVDTFWHQKHLQALSGLFFGVLAGLVIAWVLAQMVNMAANLFPAPPVAADPGPEVKPPVRPKAPAALPAVATPGEIEAHRLAREAFDREMAAYNTALVDYKTYTNRIEAWRAYIRHEKLLAMIKVLLGAAAVFMCVSFVIQTKDDFRFVIPYVEFSKQTKGARPLLLDTSVIIDGRIADIAETRILESEVIVPRFVLAELQAIADSDDKLKRNRGRRGLDVLNKLQGSNKIDIRILDARMASLEEATDVDTKLVTLAKHLDGRVVTNDYNLNKIAQLRGVDVININDLANALKPILLPGETMSVKIIKPGEEVGQGVGYLEDGTMVVAEGGRDYIGKEITITVTSVLQTSAGRMIFGRLDADRMYGRRERHAPSSSSAGASSSTTGSSSSATQARPPASSGGTGPTHSGPPAKPPATPPQTPPQNRPPTTPPRGTPPGGPSAGR